MQWGTIAISLQDKLMPDIKNRAGSHTTTPHFRDKMPQPLEMDEHLLVPYTREVLSWKPRKHLKRTKTPAINYHGYLGGSDL